MANNGMGMVGVSVSGLTECIEYLKTLEKQFPGIVQQTMEYGGNAAKEEAERLCPVDTGELRDSIYMIADETGFELGATAGHAVFNEYGCYNLNCGEPESPEPAKKKGFRPFIRPAMYKVINNLPEIFNKNWSRLHG